MGVVSTGLTEAGLKSEFFDAFNSAVKYSEQCSTRIPSTLPEEHYRFLGNLPRMREWGPGRQVHGLSTESYNVGNLRYELSLEIDADELADDQTGQIRLRIRELAEVAASHPDFILSQLLINGDQTGFVSYDNVLFFSNAHESDASGVQDNTLAPAAADPAKPTVAEIKTAIQDAIQRMMSFKNDQGHSMRIGPSGLKIIVPASMYFTVLEVLGATMIASTDNVLKSAAEVIPLPEIVDAKVFYLLKTDVVTRPFIFQDREALKVQQIGPGSEMEFIRNKFMFGVTARYRLAYGRWQFAIRAEFA